MDLENSTIPSNTSAIPKPVVLKRNGWELGDTIFVSSEIVLGILTVLVNSLVPLALWRHKQLRSRANYFICSLAVSDILEGLCVPPLAAVSHFGLPKHFYGCILMNCIVTVLVNISVLSLVCVAFDRFLSTNWPLYRRASATPVSVIILTAAAWVVGALNGLIPLMGWHEDPQGFTTCSYRRVIPLTYSVYVNFLGFLVPILFLVMAFHIKLLLSYQAHNRKLSMAYPPCSSRKKAHRLLSRQREMKVTTTLSLIFVLFAVCYFPLYIINCMRLWSPDTNVSFHLVKFTVFLSHVNPLINPVIYAFNQPRFKKVLKDSLLCCSAASATKRLAAGKSANTKDGLSLTCSSVGLYTAFASSTISMCNFDEPTLNVERLMQEPSFDWTKKKLDINPSLLAVWNECLSKHKEKEDTSISASLQEVSVHTMNENNKLSSSVSSEQTIATEEGNNTT